MPGMLTLGKGMPCIKILKPLDIWIFLMGRSQEAPGRAKDKIFINVEFR
jgi:hypothetical protein